MNISLLRMIRAWFWGIKKNDPLSWGMCTGGYEYAVIAAEEYHKKKKRFNI